MSNEFPVQRFATCHISVNFLKEVKLIVNFPYFVADNFCRTSAVIEAYLFMLMFEKEHFESYEHQQSVRFMAVTPSWSEDFHIS